MLRVEGDGVYGVDFGDVALGCVLLAVALEGEVEAGWAYISGDLRKKLGLETSYLDWSSLTY